MAFYARADYNVEGLVYTMPFPVLDAGHIQVYLDDVLLSSSSYTLRPDNTAVLFLSKPAGLLLSIRRVTPVDYAPELVQGSTYRNSSSLSLASLMAQYIKEERLDQAGQVEVVTGPGSFTEGIIGFDEDGNPIVGSTNVDELDQLVTDLGPLTTDIGLNTSGISSVTSQIGTNTSDIATLESTEASHIDDAANDGSQYVRRDGAWESYVGSVTGSGITDAPVDESLYGRKDGAWESIRTKIGEGLAFNNVPALFTKNSDTNLTITYVPPLPTLNLIADYNAATYSGPALVTAVSDDTGIQPDMVNFSGTPDFVADDGSGRPCFELGNVEVLRCPTSVIGLSNGDWEYTVVTVATMPSASSSNYNHTQSIQGSHFVQTTTTAISQPSRFDAGIEAVAAVVAGERQIWVYRNSQSSPERTIRVVSTESASDVQNTDDNGGALFEEQYVGAALFGTGVTPKTRFYRHLIYNRALSDAEINDVILALS